MYAEEHSRYALLAHGNSPNSRWTFDKRSAILVAVISLPVIIFCASYMTLFGFYDKIMYPSSNTEKGTLRGLHRAYLYNTVAGSTNNSEEFHLSPRHTASAEKFRLVCYYNFPSDEHSLQVEELDPFLCTHINVAFVEVINNTLYLSEHQEGILSKLVALKETNKDLKILLSVGGAGDDSGFPGMVFNHTNRKSFIKSVLHYVRDCQVDGVDLDWEFPNEHPAGDAHQRMHFTQLLEELRAEVNRQQAHRFLVTAAVAAPTSIVDNSYDVSYMNDYVDFVNLMSYDYHFFTKVTPFTGLNSPLYASDSERYYLATMNVNYSVHYWLSLGMDRGKIVMGLPAYGHTFRLANTKNKGLYAPSLGYGKLGTNGFADYPQICQFLSVNRISPVFDMDTYSPYAAKASEWVSFDDEQSLTFKAEYVRDMGLGGAMVYSLNSDDFRAVCDAKHKFPLVKSVRKVFG